MMNKLKNYIRSLEFSLTDISILPFFAFTIVFILEDVRLMSVNEGLTLAQPLWVFILYFVISIISLASFLFFEIRKGRTPSLIITAILLVFLVFSVLAIYLNPNVVSRTVLNFAWNPVEIVFETTYAIKFIHLTSFAFYIICLYLWVTIFPKKFHSYAFLNFICYAFYAVTIFVIIFSFVKDNYALYFQTMFGNIEDFEKIKEYAPISIFGNANGFAIFLELGVFISLFQHAIKGWKVNYILAVIYFILMPITLCKTAVLGTGGLLLIYVIVNFARGIVKKDKNKMLGFGIILGVVALVAISAVIVFFTNEAIRSKLDVIFYRKNDFTGRDLIWIVCSQIIEARIFYGNGHGIYNHILFNATYVTIDRGYINSHNSFLTLLGEGGILYLAVYVALLIYSVVVIVKMFKKNFNVCVSLLFGMLIFLFHAIFEDIYYYVELIMVFSFICYNIYKSQ